MSFKLTKKQILEIGEQTGRRFEHKDVFTIEEIEDDDNDVEYHKYDIDMLGVPLDAKFIIHQIGEDKPGLKIDAIGNTVDGDIVMFLKEMEE